ncbi:MAG: hypothetical protein WDZ94_05185 [Patescibacteria group bacterium]
MSTQETGNTPSGSETGKTPEQQPPLTPEEAEARLNDLRENFDLGFYSADEALQVLSADLSEFRAARVSWSNDKQVEVGKLAKQVREELNQALNGETTTQPSEASSQKSPEEEQVIDLNALDEVVALRELVTKYNSLISSASTGGVFDPRLESGESPLVELVNAINAAEDALSVFASPSTTLDQIRKRREILNTDIKGAQMLVDQFLTHIDAVDEGLFSNWRDEFVSSTTTTGQNLDRVRGYEKTDLSVLDSTTAANEVSDLEVIKQFMQSQLDGVESRYDSSLLKQLGEAVPGAVIDPLLKKQTLFLEEKISEIQSQIDRRNKRIEELGEQGASLAEKNRLLAEWRVDIDPLASAIEAILNPTTPLGELYNSDIRALKKELISQEDNLFEYLKKDASNTLLHEEISRLLIDLERAKKNAVVIEEIDPNDAWDTWMKVEDWIKIGETCDDDDVRERSERRALKAIVDSFTEKLWREPNAHGESGYLEFLNWDIQKGADKLLLDQIIDFFPGDQNELRNKIKFLSAAITGGMSWQHNIAETEGGPHPNVMEHIKKHVFAGSDWQKIAEFQALQEGEKPFGDLIFEGLNHYTGWNKKYVLLTNPERTKIRNEVLGKIRTEVIAIPSESELKQYLRQVEKGAKASLKTKVSDIQDSRFAELYQNAAGGDYDVFIEQVANLISLADIKTAESKKQKKYGIFPLADIGNVNFSIDAFGNRTSNVEKYRTEIAIAIGLYNIGLPGEYDPQTREMVDPTSGARTAVSNADLKRGFESGKSAELISFHVYQTHLGSSNDDNVTFQARTKPTRLRFTRYYRNKYSGQEGVYNKDEFGSLLPDLFQFMGADGKSLKKLFGDRSNRLNVNYERMNTNMKGLYLEIYSYAVKIYEVLASGLQTLEGFHFDKLGEHVAVTETSLQQQLNIDISAIGALTAFWRSVLGYWLDGRLVVDKKDLDTGFYDIDYWQNVPGTTAYTPILAKKMFTMAPADYQVFLEQVKEGDSRKVVKELQKAMLTSFTVASLLMLDRAELTLAEVEAIVYAYSKQSKHGIRQQGAGGEDPIPGYGFTEEEVIGMLDQAKRIRRDFGYVIETFLSSQSRY